MKQLNNELHFLKMKLINITHANNDYCENLTNKYKYKNLK